MRTIRFARLFCCIAIFVSVVCPVSQAQNLTTLHSFNATDGSSPYAGLVQGSDGNFYGTTQSGGSGSNGTVFQITPSGTLNTLYNFAGSDGAMPQGKLLQANDGKFYGTTYSGGNKSAGVIFQITSQGAYNKLHDFAGTDGSMAVGGLIQATDGNLYGTTFGGGSKSSGTVFKITLNGVLTTIYNFCQQSHCTDGANPDAALVQGTDGNFYGTTQNGGTGDNCGSLGCGTVFKLTPGGALTVLHSFNIVDGAAPSASLLQASDGAFYGTTSHGGPKDAGTIFRITSSGLGVFGVLYNFCTADNCPDGSHPYGTLLQGYDGFLYGTTYSGGANTLGTVYKLIPGGSGSGGYTVLHSFTGSPSDGAFPTSGLVQGRDATIYGTTMAGGEFGDGTVFTYAIAGWQFVPVTPCRVVDTRGPFGPFGGPPLGGGTSSRAFPIPQGACSIPSTATAYSLNVTVVPRGALGFLSVWPTGLPLPTVSTMNSFDGRVKADAVITPAGSNGAISVYASGLTDVVIDINGYFQLPNDSTLTYYQVTPCRVADTRNPNGPLGGPFISGDTSREFPILSSNCGIPNTAQAYSFNFTAVPHGPLGYLTVWPSDQQQPFVSTLNALSGLATANAAVVPAAKNGDISAFVTNDSDLVIDVTGYFAPVANHGLSLYALAPCRVLDTRYGNGAFQGELTVPVQGSPCPVPTTAQSYVLNATVLPQGALGFLALWADTQQQPLVSTLNSYDGSVTSNMAIVPTVNGLIDAFASEKTNLLLDINSFFAP